MSLVILLAFLLLGNAFGDDFGNASGNASDLNQQLDDVQGCSVHFGCHACLLSNCSFIVNTKDEFVGQCVDDNEDNEHTALLLRDLSLCQFVETSLSELKVPKIQSDSTTSTTAKSISSAGSVTESPKSASDLSPSASSTCSVTMDSSGSLTSMLGGLFMGVALTLVMQFILKVHRAKKQKSYTEPYTFDSFVNM